MDTRKRQQITNRQIARLLSRLAPFNLPELVTEDIKRYMWFLSEDLGKEQIGNMDKQGDKDAERVD